MNPIEGILTKGTIMGNVKQESFTMGKVNHAAAIHFKDYSVLLGWPRCLLDSYPI